MPTHWKKNATAPADVAANLDLIDKYLTKLQKEFDKIDWASVPTEDDNGGQESNPRPPKWPP